jgi:hypothetical protein
LGVGFENGVHVRFAGKPKVFNDIPTWETGYKFSVSTAKVGVFYPLNRRNFKQIGRKDTQVELANIERVNLNTVLKTKIISFEKSEKPKLNGPQRPCEAWDCS